VTNPPSAVDAESSPIVDPKELGTYSADAVGAELKDHRYFTQTRMGIWVAVTILGSLMLSVGLVFALAIAGRSSAYISSTAESLQPFILPTLGALVGYSLRAQQEHTSA
jgi:hypothetical protein